MCHGDVQAGEDPNLSRPATVDLNLVLGLFEYQSVRASTCHLLPLALLRPLLAMRGVEGLPGCCACYDCFLLDLKLQLCGFKAIGKAASNAWCSWVVRFVGANLSGSQYGQ